MEELEEDIRMIDQRMAELHQVIACNFAHLNMTYIYEKLDQMGASKRLKQFALQLERSLCQ